MFDSSSVSTLESVKHKDQMLLAILESTTDLVSIADEKGNIKYFNKAGRIMLGFEEGQDLSNLRIKDTHPKWASKIILDTGIPTAIMTGSWHGETAFLNKGGQEIPVSQVILAHKNADGSIAFFSTIARDISNIKKSEEINIRNYHIQKVVSEILEMSLQQIEIEVILQSILERIISIDWLAIESKGSIHIVENEPEILVLKAQFGLAPELLEKCNNIPFGKCLCGLAAKTKEIVFANNIDDRHEITIDLYPIYRTQF